MVIQKDLLQHYKIFKQANKTMTYFFCKQKQRDSHIKIVRFEAASSNQVGKKDTLVASDDSVGVQELLDLQSKVNDYAKQIADMEDLIKAEEDKIESVKTLLDMELQNTKLQELIIQIQSEQNSKKLIDENISDDVRLQKAYQIIEELQDTLREAIDEKREIKIEFLALQRIRKYKIIIRELQS